MFERIESTSLNYLGAVVTGLSIIPAYHIIKMDFSFIDMDLDNDNRTTIQTIILWGTHIQK